jgi:hypothetical protein
LKKNAIMNHTELCIFIGFHFGTQTLFHWCVVRPPHDASVTSNVLRLTQVQCMVSSFCCDVDENCTLLGLLCTENWWFLTHVSEQLMGPIFKGQESKKKIKSLMKWSIGCAKMLVRNYYLLQNSPEVCSSQHMYRSEMCVNIVWMPHSTVKLKTNF